MKMVSLPLIRNTLIAKFLTGETKKVKVEERRVNV